MGDVTSGDAGEEVAEVKEGGKIEEMEEEEATVLACKSFKTMNMRELREEALEHGDSSRVRLKRKLDLVEFLVARGRAKFAHQEKEPMVCGLSDELWTRVAVELQKDDIKSLVRMGKTCRQLRRVVHRSGLWASLLSMLVTGTTVDSDNTSAVLKNGHVLPYDECEEAVQAIALILPTECFNALIRNKGVKPLERPYKKMRNYRKLGYLQLDVDSLQYIFKLRRHDVRVIQGISYRATMHLLKSCNPQTPTYTNLIAAPLVLDIAFRKVKSAQCIQNLRKSVLHRRIQFNQRCLEFEREAKARKIVLPFRYVHVSQESYASEKYNLTQCLNWLKKDQPIILARNRMVQLKEALGEHNILLSALSHCCQDYIRGNGNPQLSLSEVVDKVRETGFYYRCTSYVVYRSLVLGAPVYMPDKKDNSDTNNPISYWNLVADICFGEEGAETVDDCEFTLVTNEMVADDIIDWTSLGMFMKRVALFSYLKDSSPTDLSKTLPPSILGEGQRQQARMIEIEQGLKKRHLQLDSSKKALATLCKLTLTSTQTVDEIVADPNLTSLLQPPKAVSNMAQSESSPMSC